MIVFPTDDYTPHGYLANPAHCWRLHPSGVVRSAAPVGIAWHVPSVAGRYSSRWRERITLQLGLVVDGAVLLTAEDFRRVSIDCHAPYHSSRLLQIAWTVHPIAARATFFVVDDQALAAILELTNEGATPAAIGWAAVVTHERNIGASRLWEDGLYGRAEADAVVLGCWPEGTAVVGAADRPATAVVATALPAIVDWLRQTPAAPAGPARTGVSVAGRGPRAVVGALRGDERLGPGASTRLTLLLARGQGARAARQALQAARSAWPAVRAAHEQADAAFWASAPRLTGDWPAHWRRGLVYDFETLRLVVRPPIGIFRGPWDGMQIQAPRLVLAEAALDSLALAHADPALAQAVLLGAFRDAPAPNVPCLREDGSPTMVAADGTECGTSPAWGFPLSCADLLFRLTGDRAWLADLFPLAARYLDWWLEQRTDRDGWLHYACSWESGQDDSPRFGPAVVGPEDIRHIRPVDLHAAVAQGAALLADWAVRLDRPTDAARWRAIADRYAARTRQLWHGGWFRDFDTTRGWSTVRDVMHLAPLLAGVATAEQVAALTPALAALPPHGRWDPLEWPPVVWTALEAALAVGRRDLAARHAAAVIDRVYRAMDARQATPGRPLPGVAPEHWPPSGAGGAEGYGWGALGALLLVRYLVGFQPTAAGTLVLAPVLPASLLTPGRVYAIGPLPFQGDRIWLRYAVQPDGALAVEVEGRPAGRFVLANGASVEIGGARTGA